MPRYVSDLARNDTQGMILGLLASPDPDGNPRKHTALGALIAQAEADFAGFWTVTRSQIYREVPAMETAGLVRATGENGPKKGVTYAITATGRKALRLWLAGEDNLVVRDSGKLREWVRDATGEEGKAPAKAKAVPRQRKARQSASDALAEANAAAGTTEAPPAKAPRKRTPRKAKEATPLPAEATMDNTPDDDAPIISNEAVSAAMASVEDSA